MRSRLVATLLLVLAVASLALGDVPSQVKSRLTKIDGYMAKVESALAQGRADRNNLDWAKTTLQEIEERYASSMSAPEVQAAVARIQKGEAAIAALEGKKADDKAAAQQKEQSADAIAEAWADRLLAYKPDTRDDAKGRYGSPMMDVDLILACQPHYAAAKALYDEFKATKIDPDSHWKLRDAEYNIRIGIQNYEQSIGNVVNEVAEPVRQAQTWIATQKTKPNPLIHSSARIEELGESMGRLRKLLPAGDPRLTELEGVWKTLQADQTAVEAVVLKSRRMKPDAYKGADAGTVKSLAAKILGEEIAKRYADATVKPPLKILRTHITSPGWDSESAVEWTDTTRTAWQYRTSKGVFVQVACTLGEPVFVYTLYIHRDKINGETGNLTGHVMYRDKFLKENLPK